MKTQLFWLLLFLFIYRSSSTQSIEFMVGDQYVFTDVQFLKAFDKAYKFTVFNRTRTQIDYEDQVNFFSAAYFNYTTNSGLGGTILGRLGNAGSDVDAGIHYLKNAENVTFFGLASASLTDGGIYSWFSILRYRPKINSKWKVYSSLELFTVLNKWNHAASIQRIRLGLDYDSFQFGLAANLLELGEDFVFGTNNYGVFIRKEF